MGNYYLFPGNKRINGKDFKKENESIFYAFSKTDIDESQIKKNRFDNEYIRIFEKEKMFYPKDLNDYIYEIEFLDNSEIKIIKESLHYGYNGKSKLDEIKYYLGGEFKLYGKKKAKEFLTDPKCSFKIKFIETLYFFNTENIFENKTEEFILNIVENNCFSENEILFKYFFRIIPTRFKTDKVIKEIIKKIKKLPGEKIIGQTQVEIIPHDYININIIDTIIDYQINTINNIPNRLKTYELYLKAVKKIIRFFIPKKFRTKKLYLITINENKNIMSNFYLFNIFLKAIIVDFKENDISKNDFIELCYEIVKKNGKLFTIFYNNYYYSDRNIFNENIKNELIKKSVESCGLEALGYISYDLKDTTICKIAINNDKKIIKKYKSYIPDDLIPKRLIDKEIANKMIEKYGAFINNIPTNLIDYEISYKAIKNYERDLLDKNKNRNPLEAIPKEYINNEICYEAIKKIPTAIKFFPAKLIDYKLCYEAVKYFFSSLKYIPTKLKDYKLCYEAIKNNSEAIMYTPKELIDEKLCNEAVYNNKKERVEFKLSDIPVEFRTLNICSEIIFKQSYPANVKNFCFVPKLVQYKFAIKVINEKYDLIKFLIPNLNISKEELLLEILENYNSNKFFEYNNVFNEFNLAKIVKKDLFINYRNHFKKILDEIYKKFENDKNFFNDFITFIDIFIIKLKNDKDKYLYIFEKFKISEYLHNFLLNIFKNICENSEKKIVNILNNTPKKLKNKIDFLQKFDQMGITNELVKNNVINKNKLEIILDSNKYSYIFLDNEDSNLNLKNVEYNIIEKLVKATHCNYNGYFLNEIGEVHHPFRNEPFHIDDKIIDERENKLNLYNICGNQCTYIEKKINCFEILTLFYERYLALEENNFELSMKSFEIPNKKYLKKSGYIPVFLEEILQYKKDNEIKIVNINKKLKEHIKTFDKTQGNKITKKLTIDNLLEIKKWKSNLNLAEEKLINYELIN